MNKIDITTKGQDRDSVGGPSDGKFTIEVGDETLKFRSISLTDPMPTGSQIIENAGFNQANEFLVFEVSHEHDLTELKHGDKTDIRGPQKKRFLIFKSSSSVQIFINDKRVEWGSQQISGQALKWLAKAPKEYAAWQDLKSEMDRFIEDHVTVTLTPDGEERFYTVPLVQLDIEGKVYHWAKDTITTDQIAELGGFDMQQGVVEVDANQNERNLKPGEVIKLQPGIAFSKKLRFQRGM